MIYDLLIIGGGINGCAIARDAAGRGLKVILAEQNDLASATSSASTKLIHGGLRYLENYEFRLVREALIEREILLETAPHLIHPLRFIIPHADHLRAKWLMNLGLWFYDHLAFRKNLPASESVTLRGNWLGSALKSNFDSGFAYSDCWVDDSRLVIANAQAASELGAAIKTHTKIISTDRNDIFWHARTDKNEYIQAKVIINAAGPWVSNVLDTVLNIKSSKQVRLVKGSHIITDRLYIGDHAYLLQNSDKRIAFMIPYETRFTLIGTTDVPFSESPGKVDISQNETQYLVDLVNQFLKTPITVDDVKHSYSGLRPLYDDGELNASVVTRDYAFDLNTEAAPVLSIFGGKITTARKLAEHAVNQLENLLSKDSGSWTKSASLPGGEVAFKKLLTDLRRNHPFLNYELSLRLAKAYGTKVYEIIKDARSMSDLGQNFGCDLTESEILYLVKNEWATTTEDIVWRRTKLGLHLTTEEIQNIDKFLATVVL